MSVTVFIAQYPGYCDLCCEAVRAGDEASYWDRQLAHAACAQTAYEEREEEKRTDFENIVGK